MDEFEIIQYNVEYENSVCQLLQKMNPNQTIEQIKKKLNWIYNENPYLNDIKKYPLYIAINSINKVVGTGGFFSSKYRFNDNQFFSLAAIDGYVDSDYRRRGIFNDIFNFGLVDLQNSCQIKTFLNLSANQYSLPGCIKLGWLPMQTKTYLYKYNYIPQKVKLNFLFNFKFKGYEVVIQNKIFKNEFDDLVNLESDKFTLLRDDEYFKWRMNNPNKSNNMIIKLYKNHNLVAYAILKNINSNNYSLFEYKYKSILDFKLLLKYINYNINYKLLSVWALSRAIEEVKIFKLNGFIHLKKNFFKIINRPKSEALVRPNKFNPIEEDWFLFGKDIRDINNWDLFYSDVDG